MAVTSQVPWPLDRGGHLRTFHLLKGLAKELRVTLIAGAMQPVDLNPFESVGIVLRPVTIPKASSWREMPRAAWCGIQGIPYVCFGRHNRAAVRSALEQELASNSPRVLYLDHLDSLQYASTASQTVRIVIDLHNVYSQLIERNASERGAAAAMYLRREASLLAHAERRAVETADALFAVSEADRKYFQRCGPAPVHVVPNGVACEWYADLPIGLRSGPPVLLYIGALSWGPNAAAAEFLVQRVLPSVRSSFPDAVLKIIGRRPSEALRGMGRQPGVTILEDVDDVRPHLRAAHVAVVPLESGGGSRLKILEAFAAGVPVVSTPIGAEGLDVTSGEHLIIADRDDLASAVARLLSAPKVADTLAHNARGLVRQRYDWTSVAAAAAAIVTELAKR